VQVGLNATPCAPAELNITAGGGGLLLGLADDALGDQVNPGLASVEGADTRFLVGRETAARVQRPVSV